ncbi:MAG: RimK-like protein, partial [Ardenticatenaceae bacterium]
LFAYATVHPGTELRDDAVAAAPLFAQRVLHPKTDIRVTLVGDDLFPVRILSRGAGVAGDWRLAPRADLEYQDLLLDDDTANRCRQLARRLGLSFAAIDLIETADGIFFVEVNPTGEWGWLSTAARPIDRAIASWLASPTRHAG